MLSMLQSAVGSITGSATAAASGAVSSAQQAAQQAVNSVAGKAPTVTAPSVTDTVSSSLTSATGFFDDNIAKPVSKFASYVSDGIMGNGTSSQNWTVRGALLIIIIGIIFIILWKTGTFERIDAAREEAAKKANTLNATTGSSGATTAAGASASTPSQGFVFVDSQPLTIRHAGYTPDPQTGGTFNIQEATLNALRAGFRAFTVQIDYLDTNKGQGYAPAGDPTIVVRSRDGSLVSRGTGDLTVFFTTLANAAYRSEYPNSAQPLLLYLHILHAPSPVRARDAYLTYLSKIATALAPLAPTHLGITPFGTFQRQRQEAQLLVTPISALEGKTIILCNADTSMFRSEQTGGGPQKFPPAKDLDYWVNMRVYLDTDDTEIGVARMPDTGAPAYAVVVPFERLTGMNQARADAFAQKGKARFVVAVPTADANPAAADLDRVLTDIGANMVPIDIFSVPTAGVNAYIAPYNRKSYKAKSDALRKVAQ